MLIGCNPRLEATMLNARIRKATIQNSLKVFSFGNPGDLTYSYKVLGNNTSDIKDFLKGTGKFSETFKKAKKPLVIIGEEALELKSGGYIFEEIKEHLIKNGFINDDWNALNILHRNASSVGALDMGLIENTSNKESFFSNLNNKKFKFLYLLGSDNLKINKDGMFIVYQGSHGDRSAEIADVILPGSAYTEQNGLYANLEGRVQECKKASYPPGLAKEDYQILNELNLQLFNKKLFNKFGDIRNEAVNNIANFSGYENLPKKISLKSNKITNEFFDEELKIDKVDYYFTNSISRSSKTMSECREARMKSKI